MRPITLFTGQWADLPLKTMAEKAASWGYQGLELAASGDHLDIDKAATDKKYCKKLLDTLKKNNLKVGDQQSSCRAAHLRSRRRQPHRPFRACRSRREKECQA